MFNVALLDKWTYGCNRVGAARSCVSYMTALFHHHHSMFSINRNGDVTACYVSESHVSDVWG